MSNTHPFNWWYSFPAVVIGLVVWFLVWLVIENLWYRRVRRFRRSGREVRLSLGTFLIVGMAQVLMTPLLVPVLGWMWPHRFWTLPMSSLWPWLLAWVVTDFAYYWIHRGLHETRLGWSLHSPHHSTQQLTLPDSLRSSWGEQPVGVFVYGIPLVLMGVPPYIAGSFYIFVAAFQFVVHTEISWGLGPLQGIIYTPADHRIHHSRLRQEADSNYGGFFMIWDRLFGTYTPVRPDQRPAEYGLPDTRPDTLPGVILGELRRFLREWSGVQGMGAKLRFALTREMVRGQPG